MIQNNYFDDKLLIGSAYPILIKVCIDHYDFSG